MKSLSEDVRSEKNLFSAWRHVKKSALNSSNTKIKGYAAEFEYQHQRHIKRIATQLREKRFFFDEVTGVLKDKKKRLALKKDPRPIAVATIKNRIVQRAILQILQPRQINDEKDINSKSETVYDSRLGKINLINRSKYGVGGLLNPYGGVKPAIKLALQAMAEGGRYYYQSDIKSFFTKVPTKNVLKIIEHETKDQEFTSLIAQGFEVKLDNKDELKSFSDLFPSKGIGVAQGSSLSALAGNILLYDLDHDLNNMGVTAIRYIDDLLIIAKEKDNLHRAKEYCATVLKKYNLDLYKPEKGSLKASEGECSMAFNFLGCTLQINRCVPSKSSVKRVKNDIEFLIKESKQEILDAIGSTKPIDLAKSRSATLQVIKSKLYGWQKSFTFCTERETFATLDKSITKKIIDYENWIVRKTNKIPPSQQINIFGIPNTEQMYTASKSSILSK